MTNLVLFHVPCVGLDTYTLFRVQTRIPSVTKLVLIMHLAVVSVPTGCLPPHVRRPRGRPARGSGRGLDGARDLPVPRAKKSGGVAKASKRRFRDQLGEGISGGASLIRDAIDL